MPSDLAATIDINNWGSVYRALECFCPTASCINRRMFQKQHGVWNLVCHYFLMQIALQIPRSLILNGIATKPNLINYKLHGLSLGHGKTH
jgi:hypothetical protein